MTLKELQPQLLSLTPEEKSQAIQILVQSLSKRSLHPRRLSHPHRNRPSKRMALRRNPS